MADYSQQRVLLYATVIVVALVGVGLAFAGSTAAQTADIIVDVDGNGNYTSIQAAIDNATDDDTIAIESGTYNESVIVDKNVTIVANESVTVTNGSTTNATAGITIQGNAAPVISGFTVEDWETGVDAYETTGNWTVDNTSVRDARIGINADTTTGNWTIVGSQITNVSDDGIAATDTNGTWLVRETTIRNSTGRGIDAVRSAGAWTIEVTTIEEAQQYGIATGNSNSEWQIRDVTVRDSNVGVDAPSTTEGWRIDNSSFTSNTYGVIPADSGGQWMITNSSIANNTVGLLATNTTGEWEVKGSTFENNSDVGLNATGSVYQGEAPYNYWNAADGPSGVYNGSGDLAVGNVGVRPFFEDAALTDLIAPEFNETASSVTPTTTSANETRTYTINIAFDNSTLTNESGEVDVTFESFGLETAEDDLTINYTEANISDGTLTVSTSVNATAPNTAGIYEVAVTDLRTDTPDETLIDDANIGIGFVEVTDSTSDGTLDIKYDPVGTSNVFKDSDARTSELLRIASENRTSFELGGSRNRSLRVVNPDTSENVTVTQTFEETYNISELSFVIYRSDGVVFAEPKVSFFSNDTINEKNVSVTGDLVMFQNGSQFAPYQVELLSENGTVIGSTEPAIHGIGYQGQLEQNATSGTIEVTLNRSAAVNESWPVTYTVHNETDQLLTQSVNNSAANANFTATVDASMLENGTYDHEFVISPSADTERGDRILGIEGFEPLTVGSVTEPDINATASSVTPINATTNETQQYTVDVTIDNTTLTDESGEVDVDFENFMLESGVADLTINYTADNITDGTVAVSSTVNATAPETPGVYDVNVTDLRTEEPYELLLDDANVTIGTLDVSEATVSEQVAIEYNPNGAGARFGFGDDRQTSEELQIVSVNETPFELGGSINRSFRVVNTETGESVTVSPELGAPTYNVTEVDLDIYGPTGGIRSQPELAFYANDSFERLNATVEGDTAMFSNATPFAPYRVDLQSEDGTVLGSTRSAVHGVGYAGALEQNSTTGTIEVTLNRSTAVNESWAVEYRVDNETDVLTQSVNNSAANTNFTATVDATTLVNGTYDHRFTISPSADAELGDRIISVAAFTELEIGSENDTVTADPDLNATATSITPTSVQANETEVYDVTVTLDNTSLTDQSGELDIDVADFELESGEPDLTINYTADNITDGTLSVSGSVTATAPATAGVRDINLAELRIEGPAEGPIENAAITLDTIEVLEDTSSGGGGGGIAADPVVNTTVSSVTPTTAYANESEEFRVDVTIDNTSLTNASGEVDLRFENFTYETGDDLTINYTASNISNGTLVVSEEVIATAPVETGNYSVNVTDLRIEGSDDPDDSLIEDANITIGTVEVIPSQPNASEDSYTVAAGETLTVPAPGVLGNDTDPNNDSLTVETVATPVNGTLSLLSNGSFEYTPEAGFTGTDTFAYAATDPAGNTDTADVTITVTDAVPESLDVSLAQSAIPNGTNTSLTANATLTNGSTVDVTETDEVVLTSSDESIVTVDSAGIVTALAEGSTTLNASYESFNGTFNASTTITVEPAAVAALNISLADDRIDSDEETSLTVNATLTNGSTRDVTTAANITADNESLVSVDNTTGTITGESAGNVTLTATYEGQTASTVLAVEVPPLTVDRTAIEFGNVSVTNESVQQVTVTNNASTDISIETAALNGSGADQFAVPNATGTVQANSTRTINASFAPTTNGTATTLLELTTTQPDRSPESISLTGTGIAPRVTVTSALPVELAAEQNESHTTTVQISNDGTDALNVTVAINDSDVFSTNDTLDIPAGGSDSVTVEFSPTTNDTGTIGTELTVTPNNTAVDAVSVPVNGTVLKTNLSIRANESSIIGGEPVRFTVTDDEGTFVNATVELSTKEVQTGPDGNVTATIETAGSYEIAATKEPTAAYRSDSWSLTVDEPTLTVDETSVDFDNVTLGSSTQAQVTLVNNASTDVAVDAAALGGTNPSVFSLGEVPSSVAADTNRTVNVSFTPTTRDSFSATLDLGDDTVGLSGTGIAPQINVTSPQPVELAAKQDSSDTATVQINNDGDARLNATLVTNGTRFNTDTTVDIPAGGSDSVTVEFNASQNDLGSYSTDLTITPNNTAVDPLSVPVSGTVLERSVALRQSNIGFGNVTVGETVESAVVVDNTGTTTEKLNVTTTNETRFDLVDASDETIELAPGDSERLAVEVTLTSSGPVTETLTVQNDSAPTVVKSTATLNATGRAPQLNVTTIEPVEFDDTPVNSTSTETIRIDNDGEATLQVSLNEAFNTTEAANFSVVGSTSFEIPADESRNVTIGFTPQTVFNATANLSLVTNDIGATAAETNVSLTGAGSETDLQISEDIPAFGAVGVGGSATENLTIVNNGSELDLSETVSNSEFTVSSRPEDPLGANENTTVSVTFEPSANGSRTGTLQITGTEPGTGNETTITTSLAGTGRYGELSVAQQTLRTGVTTTDGTTEGSVTVENAGLNDTTVTIDDISIVDDTNFSVANGLSVGDTLGSEAGSLAVEFDPEDGAENGEQQTTLILDASSGERTFTRNLTVVGVVSAPEPTVSTDALSVGTVTAGEQTLEEVVVSNDGGEPFEITDLSATGSGVFANLNPTDTAEVVPGGESGILIRVNRSTTGPFTSDVTVETTDEDRTVTVTGDTAAPDLNVTAESVDFGETPVGSASQAEITIRNDGNASLTVSRPTITGDSGTFSILSGDRRLRIAAGGSQNVSLGFGPNTNATATGTLVIESDNDPTDTEGPREIELTGIGTTANARLDTSAVNFGDISQGDNSSRTLNISNDGSATLSVSGASLIGSDSGAYNVSGLATGDLAPGASEEFTVTVNTTDSARGSLSSQLVINTDDADVTSQLGATVVAPDIEVGAAVNPDRFGTTRLGTTSTAMLAVNNTGNAELDLTDLSVTGPDSPAFSVIQSPATVDEQATGRVIVEFDPGAIRGATGRAQNTPLSAEATLNITSNDPDSSEQYRTVRLGGEGVTGAIETPRTFQFGDVGIGSTASSQLTVENTLSATAPLNITAVEVSGADAGDYTVQLNDSDTPATLRPGETATVDVSLRPTSPGQKFATLSVYTNDTRQPVKKIGLSNTETVYQVDYGSVNVSYINPTAGPEPTVNVDEGLRGRNASLRTVSSNATTDDDYTLNYTFGSTAADVGYTDLDAAMSETNLTALRYMNATTSADAGNFSDSTFQIEVSKAALAEQEVTPENVTIYHETDKGGYETVSDTELLFETTQGYVYEATTDSYSVFAVGVPDKRTVESISISLDETTLNESESTTATVIATYDDGSVVDVTDAADITSGDTRVASVSGATVSADSEGTASIQAAFEGLTASVDLTVNAVDPDDGDEDDGDDETTTPSTGGSTTTEEAEEETTDTTIADIVDQVSQSEPATDVTAEITDGDPETPGVTVEAEGTQSVGRITFADESVTGSVSVREYQPSAELTTQIEETMSRDLAGDSSDGSDDGSSDGSSDGETTVRLRSLTDISPDSSAASESAATVELSVDRDELDDPANAFVVHETDSGWERLETTVEEREGGTVRLTAETDSFSLFAVAETQQTRQSQPSDGSDAETDGEATTSDDGETTDDTGDTGGSSVLPLIGVLVIVAAVAAVLWISRKD